MVFDNLRFRGTITCIGSVFYSGLLACQVVQLAKRMSKKTNVTATVVAKKAGISRAQFFRILKRNSVFYSALPAKSIWSLETVEQRRVWAEKHVGKSEKFWRKFFYIDNKTFHIFASNNSKKFHVRQARKGAWIQRGDRLGFESSSPKKSMKFNTGFKPVNITCGVHHFGRVFFCCNAIKWNSQAASRMYRKLSAFAGKNRIPLNIIEDNDPSGYESGLVRRTKRELNYTVLKLPKRTPELMPLDYSIWSHIDRKMAESNERMLLRGAESETKFGYLMRLRRCCQRIPARVIANTIDSMKKRVEKLHSVRGDVFRD